MHAIGWDEVRGLSDNATAHEAGLPAKGGAGRERVVADEVAHPAGEPATGRQDARRRGRHAPRVGEPPASGGTLEPPHRRANRRRAEPGGEVLGQRQRFIPQAKNVDCDPA